MRTIPAAAAVLAAAFTAVPAHAEAGDVLVRLRAILVSPTEDAGPVLPAAPTASVSVDDAVMPEIDFTYMITNHVGAELILATTNHDINATGALAGLGKIADTWVLPPTLTLQYHFLPDAPVRPYVGAGVNYTIFYSADASNSLTGALGPTKVELDDSFGYALQAGVDIDLNDRVFVNLDAKYIDMDTVATLTSGAAVNAVAVDLDPIVASIGIGMRF